MELTLDNLVNEIVKQESIYHDYMLESENLFGRESNGLGSGNLSGQFFIILQ